jgi:5-(aminomethyl)-3-furanmethanol phosphate kinase
MKFSVVKVGGSLIGVPGALARVCSVLAEASLTHPLVIVPGGGPFADAVREFDRRAGISPDAAHWMAILAMDQYAQVLAERIRGACLVDQPGAILDILAAGRIAVLAPARWMRAADVLPHSWEVTSDSIAAFIAGALGAEQLILIKPTAQGQPVDPFFQTALPAGMPYLVLGWERVEELPARLSGQTAAAAPVG